jgi:hypothetical protein
MAVMPGVIMVMLGGGLLSLGLMEFGLMGFFGRALTKIKIYSKVAVARQVRVVVVRGFGEEFRGILMAWRHKMALSGVRPMGIMKFVLAALRMDDRFLTKGVTQVLHLLAARAINDDGPFGASVLAVSLLVPEPHGFQGSDEVLVTGVRGPRKSGLFTGHQTKARLA